MKKMWDKFGWLLTTMLGSAIYGLSYSIFLSPNDLNAGGISGLAAIIVQLVNPGGALPFIEIGTLTILINLPLFAIGGVKIGKKFFFGSLVGLALSSVVMDYVQLPVPLDDTLLAALYGAVMAGLGLGLVFMSGTSTGGSDIVVRLVKLKARHLPIGQIAMAFDVFVVALTGIVFGDIRNALYTGITAFLCSKVIDMVVYGFDNSKVAMIITREHEHIAKQIGDKLGRGATYLHSQGTYSGVEGKVVLVAVKRQQIAELKELVTVADPNAFVIMMEAHQVLGDGFARYTKDSL